MFVAALLTAAVAAASPFTPRSALPWNDWNFISTTDIHGYVAGHGTADGGKYSANIADVAIWIDQMKAKAAAKNVELFVVDSGDWHDGTAYSDKTSPDGLFTDPLISRIQYDVLSIGNHELYNNITALEVRTNVSSKFFPDQYLTGNIRFKVHKNGSVVDFSKKVRKFIGTQGTKVTALGFLFDGFIAPTGTAQNAVQLSVSNATKEQWFKDALVDKPDLFLLTGHIALRGNYVQTAAPEWKAAISAIRAVYPTVPIVVFGGHYHVRDFIFYDDNAFGLSAGRYMETLGWMSLAKAGAKSSVDRRYLDCNTQTLNYHLGLDETAPALGTTNQKGQEINALIAKAGATTNASVVLGYAPHDFYLNRVNASDDHSTAWLWETYMAKVYQKPNGNPAYFVSNVGTLRSDVFGGPFTIENAFEVLPFANNLYVIEGLDFSV
ncbi:Metallo-dependent phosphatase-like protein, partial [Chytriomyces sp. MP71]